MAFEGLGIAPGLEDGKLVWPVDLCQHLVAQITRLLAARRRDLLEKVRRGSGAGRGDLEIGDCEGVLTDLSRRWCARQAHSGEDRRNEQPSMSYVHVIPPETVPNFARSVTGAVDRTYVSRQRTMMRVNPYHSRL